MIPTHRFITSLQVWRYVTADDGGGGQTTDLQQVGTVSGQVSQPSSTERRLAQQDGADLTHVVHMAPDADVQRNDRLVHGDGRELDVIATVVPSRTRYLRADCVAVQSGG